MYYLSYDCLRNFQKAILYIEVKLFKKTYEYAENVDGQINIGSLVLSVLVCDCDLL